MQTRTYGDLFKLIQSLAGVQSFASSEQDDIASFINRRFYTAYNSSQAWPRYLVPNEERILASIKVSGITNDPPGAGASNATSYNGLYYKIGNDNSSKENPVYVTVNPTSTTSATTQNKTSFFYKESSALERWVFAAGSYGRNQDGSIAVTPSVTLRDQKYDDVKYDNPWDVVWDNDRTQFAPGLLSVENVQTVGYGETIKLFSSNQTQFGFKDTIGEFVKIFRDKPLVNRSVSEYDFYVDEDGAHILNVKDSSTSDVYVTYKKKFEKFTTSSDYSSSTEEVPLEFFAYIAHGAYADFLTMDGQTSKAIVESDRAEEHLFKELERIDIISNNNRPVTKFSTYVNKQAR